MKNPDLVNNVQRRIRRRKNQTSYDLFCFDKVNKGFFSLISHQNMNRKFQRDISNLFQSQEEDFDITYLNDELIIAGRANTSTFIFKTKLRMNKIQ